ncbi:MAG TPA: adenylate/guanylate cyclase domain-containing protein [Candidatus Binataceae bacterium]|nr:adenylate/guanylate cyclase domain-containing protein [Candidatus Binataceae bacterium]
MRWVINQRWARAFTIAIGLLTIAAVTSLKQHYPNAFEWAELKASDLRIYRGGFHKPSGKVVIATIDDKSISEFGRFPWPRSVEARLMRALREYNVAVVGFDVTFTERDPGDVQREELVKLLEHGGTDKQQLHDFLNGGNDQTFADAIRQQGSTYLGFFFRSHMFHEASGAAAAGFLSQLVKPWPVAYNMTFRGPGARQQTYIADAYLPPIQLLNSAARGTAYVDVDEDSDGTARSEPAVIRFDGRYCVPLFLAMAQAYLGEQPLSLRFDADGVSEIQLGREKIPVNQRGDMMVNFRGKAGSMPQVSIADIISHRAPIDALARKIVLVGLTAHALGDRIVAPVGGDFPGVEFQATAIDNVLAGDFIYSAEHAVAVERMIAWLMGLATTIAAALMTAFSSALIMLLIAAGYIAYASWELSANGRLVGVVFPLFMLFAIYLAIVSFRYFAEGREKRFIRSAFERYVHPEYVAALMEDASRLKLGGERRHLSILFADIMGFTSRAERSDPKELVALLNEYMTAMINVVFSTGGVVDKLMGDGIMAFWGAPIVAENPARDAINCALGMLQELKRLAVHDRRFEDIHIGIGIATGDAIVGNFGGDKKFDYSAIGDTVNLASRLEGLTRQFKINILVNQPTYDEAGGDYIARKIGLVKVKGKDQLVPVIEIAAHRGDGLDFAHYQRFSDAIAMLRQGESPEAALRTLHYEWPDDHVIEMCLERLRQTNGESPREMIFEFDTK